MTIADKQGQSKVYGATEPWERYAAHGITSFNLKELTKDGAKGEVIIPPFEDLGSKVGAIWKSRSDPARVVIASEEYVQKSQQALPPKNKDRHRVPYQQLWIGNIEDAAIARIQVSRVKNKNNHCYAIEYIRG